MCACVRSSAREALDLELSRVDRVVRDHAPLAVTDPNRRRRPAGMNRLKRLTLPLHSAPRLTRSREQMAWWDQSDRRRLAVCGTRDRLIDRWWPPGRWGQCGRPGRCGWRRRRRRRRRQTEKQTFIHLGG